jgi:hypothetical protein
MEDRKKAKKFLLAGAITGGLLSLTISLLMDVIYADIQGTWRDAIAKDLNTFFHLGVSPKNLFVYIVFFFVLGILTAFGAFLGFIFSFFLYRFFSFLNNK